jgi:gliding motility-associated lipoprotein GldD
MKPICHFCFAFFVLFLTSCEDSEENTFKPKPRGYHHIPLPEAKYVSLPDTMPYRFEYSGHARLMNDTSYLTERYWMEVYYPFFKANLDISYKRIENEEQFKNLINDSHKLANNHGIKAFKIDQMVMRTPKGLTGILFELEGDVPTTCQFYVTDSVRNFLRVDFYFATSQENDSLAPIIKFIKEDMIHMINTTEWNEKVKADVYQSKTRKWIQSADYQKNKAQSNTSSATPNIKK